MKSMKVFIEGMHCNSCSALLTGEFSKIDGVLRADISLKDSSGEIYYEGEEPSFEEIRKRAAQYGYTVKKNLR